MIVQQPGTPERVRISGSLTGDAIRSVLDAVARGVAVLDLSEVDRVDDGAVRALVGLSERCVLENCPRWLALWLERTRSSAAGGDD